MMNLFNLLRITIVGLKKKLRKSLSRDVVFVVCMMFNIKLIDFLDFFF